MCRSPLMVQISVLSSSPHRSDSSRLCVTIALVSRHLAVPRLSPTFDRDFVVRNRDFVVRNRDFTFLDRDSESLIAASIRST